MATLEVLEAGRAQAMGSLGSKVKNTRFYFNPKGRFEIDEFEIRVGGKAFNRTYRWAAWKETEGIKDNS